MITIVHTIDRKTKRTHTRLYDNHQLPDVCLAYNGGGMTAEGTRTAMAMKSMLESTGRYLRRASKNHEQVLFTMDDQPLPKE